MSPEQKEAWEGVQRTYRRLRDLLKEDGSGYAADEEVEDVGFMDDYVRDLANDLSVFADELAEATDV